MIEQIIEKIKEPCMGEPCKEFIVNYIKKNNIKSVLEFGSGGFTLMFRELGCRVTTIEHDPQYYVAIRELTKDTNMIFPILAIDKKSYMMLYLLTTYVDLVFIDGRWREDLMRLFYNSKDFNATLMVHDSERESYQEEFNKLREIREDISPKEVNIFVCKNKYLS